MQMTCNIDRRGRVIRLLAGFILFFGASLLFVVGVPGATTGWRIFHGVLVLLGIFMMFEGVMGWCAIRALGAKTRL